jgi:LPXTG-motif cell wall-anchored protein
MVGGGFTQNLTWYVCDSHLTRAAQVIEMNLTNKNCSGTGYACRTQTIFSAFSSTDAGYNLKILCANNYFTGETIYRDIATSTSSSSTSSSTSTSSSSSTSSTPMPAATTSLPNGVVDQASTSSSNSWIAGAVVGPLAGLAIIAGLIWFFLRRRRNQKHGVPVEVGSAAWSPAPPSAVNYKTVPMEENQAVVGENRMSELAGSNVYSSFQPSELPDNSRSYK